MDEFLRLVIGVAIMLSVGSVTALLKVWKTQGIHAEMIKAVTEQTKAYAQVPERLARIEQKLDDLSEVVNSGGS